LVDDALEDALRPLPQEGQTEIEIIVNGQPVNVTAGPIREVIAEAVQRSGQIGAPIDQWVLRTTDGEVIPHALPGGVEWALSGGQRLWLHLGLPASLRLSETTQLTKDEDDLTRSGEPVTAPSDVHASSSRAVPASGSVELEAALKYAIALVADRISFEASDNRALLARYVEALREVVALAELDYASNSPRKPQPKGSATDSSSSLSPSETPEGWQPISTAPKDGTKIHVARYVEGYGWILGISRYEQVGVIGGWISTGLGIFGELGLAHPTHWMPLPAPPVTRGSE
jgi:hypothetical protein